MTVFWTESIVIEWDQAFMMYSSFTEDVKLFSWHANVIFAP